MKMMQTRFGVDDIKLMIAYLDNDHPSGQGSAADAHAAELAARLRWRAIKLWGTYYAQDDGAGDPGQLAMDFASVPFSESP
jgi:hypothetical protein